MLNLWTRRRFLRTVGQGALAAALPRAIFAAAGDCVTISILHTTDLHGHILPTTDYAGRPDLGGFARCATQIRNWRRENPASILVDVGDVYEGTQVSLETRGALMIRCLNALNYDAWVVGNHELDWGPGPLVDSVKSSTMPVLSANARWEGKAVVAAADDKHPGAGLRSYVIKEVEGFRVAVIGLTTPALTAWLPPEYLAGFESLDPVQTLREVLRELAGLRIDAVVVAGHMGLKRADDFANQVGRLTHEFPEVVVFLGGHTHQNQASEWINGVLYTQADHFGIYAGKVDLTFDRASRRLVQRQAVTVPMDHQVALDPVILALCRSELEMADRLLAREVGVLTEPFAAIAPAGEASDQERLIGSGMLAALRARQADADVVIHGLFENSATLAPGPKTVEDLWTLLPYENEIVSAELSYADLRTVAEELLNAHDRRAIMGMRVGSAKEGSRLKVTEIRAADGSALPVRPAYRVAMNSYDSQSAGGRLPILARAVAAAGNCRRLHPVQVRDAVMEFFVARGNVGRTSLLI